MAAIRETEARHGHSRGRRGGDAALSYTDAIMFANGEHFDVAAVAAAQPPWWNRTLCAVNDSVVRLGVLEGDFHWHKHDSEDEFFFVARRPARHRARGPHGQPGPNQAFTVPAGVDALSPRPRPRRA